MDGIDKLTTPIGGPAPPRLDARGARRRAGGIERVVVAVAADRLAGASWPSTAPRRVGSRSWPAAADARNSVAAGIDSLDAPDDRVLLVHDGARPAVRPGLVTAVIEAVRRMARRSRSCRWPRPPSASRDGLVLETVDRIGPGHGADAAGRPGRPHPRVPGPSSRPMGRPPSPMRPPSSRRLESRSMRSPVTR